MSAIKSFSKTIRRKLLVSLGTFLLSVSAGLGLAESLSVADFWECLLQAFALVGSPKALHISTYTGLKIVRLQTKTKGDDIDIVQKIGIQYTVTLEVSTKLLFRCFRALFASSSDIKPTKPNFRNLPSLVNLREQSVTVPNAANIALNLSSFICRKHSRLQVA